MAFGAKGQLISKRLYGILNSSKKRTKKFDITTMIHISGRISFVFWKNIFCKFPVVTWPIYYFAP